LFFTSMPDSVGPDETLDVLCNDKVKVIQKKKGYRLSLDPLLLSNFLRLKAKETLLDVGCGCGIIPIYLAKRGCTNHLVGIEIQRDLYELSMRNRQLNECHNMEFIHGDIRNPDKNLGHFHVIVSNPPYRKVNSGRTCPDPSRLMARCEVGLDLDTLTTAATSRLYTHGRLYVIYPVKRLPELMLLCSSKGLQPKRIRFIHSRLQDAAVLCMVECVKGGGADLTVDTPLCLYTGDDYTEEVKAYYE
jgi:tRNA1Val (adenine37-N6)-methyltransferase